MPGLRLGPRLFRAIETETHIVGPGNEKKPRTDLEKGA